MCMCLVWVMYMHVVHVECMYVVCICLGDMCVCVVYGVCGVHSVHMYRVCVVCMCAVCMV